MNKIFLVVSREYLTRVRKKSFVVMTILGPLLIALLYAFIIWSATKIDEIKKVEIVDETGLFVFQLESNKIVNYKPSLDLEESKAKLSTDEIAAVLYIPKREYTLPRRAFIYYSNQEPSMALQSNIHDNLQSILRDRLMIDVLEISDQDIELIKKTGIKVSTENITTGKASFIGIKTGLGLILGMLIYFFIFMFGSQVMRGVMEEKTNRIVEVIVSSVKPFQLMMGKIIGIALIGLTQFLLWVVLSFVIITGIQLTNSDIISQIKQQDISTLVTKGADLSEMAEAQSAGPISEMLEGLLAIDFSVIIWSFFFFFIFGYLVYASLFAAIGSLIENETDSNQFVLPITIPMIAAIMVVPTIINNPSGPLAFWLSVIPFTSPIIMMVRIPFGVPYWEIILSIGLLILTFVFATWLAAKIYRVGILMYGKKITYREILKWLKYKN